MNAPLSLCKLLALLGLLSMARSELPNPLILQRADPWVYLHDDGRYYFTATYPDYDRIELRAADPLAGLACAEPRTVWWTHPSGPMSRPIWAPEIHFVEGKWYLYYAAGDTEKKGNSIRMYALENASPDPMKGDWVEKGRVLTEWDTFCLDATVFTHGGVTYYVWAQHKPGMDGNTGLFIAAMENPWTLKLPATELTMPEFDWERRLYKVDEGPAVLKRNGRVFIAYSASGTDHNYCMGLLTADDGADLLAASSWTKSPQPVFQSSAANGIYGPGHNSFTRGAEGADLMVYHARNYKEIEGDPLADHNRHARVQALAWNEDGTPRFGVPRPETAPRRAAKPLFRDPLYDGAADPVVLWNPHRGRWWMYYTNRRARADGLAGVAWVHGTHLGIAESCDGGASWTPFGTAQIELPVEVASEHPTHWAPEVMTAPDGLHHMYLTVVPGVFEDWQHPRRIVHLTSVDMHHWQYVSTLSLASDRVIDACVAPLPDGTWRMWYNNERDGKSIHYADSPDLFNWTEGSRVVGDRAGEGPKVFRWQGAYWMVTDVWKGLGVYRSEDGTEGTRQDGDNLLEHPGSGEDDGVIGGHPDVVVQGDRAFLFYFTHPGRTGAETADRYATRRSSIQVTELTYADGRLSTDRDQPVFMKLDPRFVSP